MKQIGQSLLLSNFKLLACVIVLYAVTHPFFDVYFLFMERSHRNVGLW